MYMKDIKLTVTLLNLIFYLSFYGVAMEEWLLGNEIESIENWECLCNNTLNQDYILWLGNA